MRHGETDAESLTYYEYDEANELLSLHDVDGWTYFGYDANGNTVMEQTPGYTRYYDWDGRDMMVGVRSTEQGWTDNEYRYDGVAARVSTLESMGLSYYDWDGINVLQEKTGAGTVTDRQVHGYAPIFSVGDIAHMDRSGTPYVPVSDQVGTIWNLLNAAASKVNSYTYDAFGVGRSVSETAANLYRFGTKRLAPDAGLYYFPPKEYKAATGRLYGVGATGSARPSIVPDANPLVQTSGSTLGADRVLGSWCYPERRARLDVREFRDCMRAVSPTRWPSFCATALAACIAVPTPLTCGAAAGFCGGPVAFCFFASLRIEQWCVCKERFAVQEACTLVRGPFEPFPGTPGMIPWCEYSCPDSQKLIFGHAEAHRVPSASAGGECVAVDPIKVMLGLSLVESIRWYCPPKRVIERYEIRTREWQGTCPPQGPKPPWAG